MITVHDLLDLFRDKLERTLSFDAAFTKATWVAYTRGYDDGYAAAKQDAENALSLGAVKEDRWSLESFTARSESTE